MIYEGGDGGSAYSLECEWQQERQKQEMLRLSGEPYKVYVNGVGWVDAENEAARPQRGRVATGDPQGVECERERERANPRVAPDEPRSPCEGRRPN